MTTDDAPLGADTLGELLRTVRLHAGLPQREVAARLGIAQPTLSRWESGSVVPRLDDADAVLGVYGKQLAFEAVRRYDALSTEFARLAARDADARVWEFMAAEPFLLSRLSALEGDVVIGGGLAAVLHGMPIETPTAVLLVRDDDEVLDRVCQGLAQVQFLARPDGHWGGARVRADSLRDYPRDGWRQRGTELTWRLLGPDEAAPPSQRVVWGSQELVVVRPEALEPDAGLRAPVLTAWLAWHRARSGDDVAA